MLRVVWSTARGTVNTYLLHVVPVRHDSVFDGVLQGKNPSLGLRLIPNIRVLLPHTHHNALVPRAAHDAGEHRARGVVARETSLVVFGNF